MLQRAASNAYSWWMASHIRTKQSKWMEQNLQDMEEKVTAVLKLIQEDGDSFIQKAEMYYRKRPEIISFVEEFFRAYRALAERYDHLSTELQNANNTIASICPDQVCGLDDDDFDCEPKFPKKAPDNTGKVPKAPKVPVKELKFITNTKKKVQEKKKSKPSAPSAKKSGLTKEEGIGEIDRIQKRILTLQTEKEFVKSSYESRSAKYREVDNEIKELQGDSLEIVQGDTGSTETGAAEIGGRIRSRAKEDQSIEGEGGCFEELFLSIESAAELTRIAEQRAKKREANVHNIVGKPKDNVESEAGDTDSEADVPDKIDVLVNKVTSLETTNLSQAALLQRLKWENDELVALTQSLEDGKANLVDGKQDLKGKMIDLELKWQAIQDLNHTVENLTNNMQSRFNDAHSNLDELFQNVKPIENLKSSSELWKNETKEKPKKAKAGKEFLEPKATSSPAETKSKSEKGSERSQHVATDSADASKEVHSVPKATNEGDESSKVSKTFDSKAMAQVVRQSSSLIAKSDSKENELATLSQALEETKKQLMELKTNHQNELFEITLELKELKDLNSKKDKQIRSLRLKACRGQTGIGKSKDEGADEFQEWHETKTIDPPVKKQVKEVEEDLIPKPVYESKPISAIEEKFRTDIDELLEENLDFWYRFSSTLYELQKYQSGVKDLEAEVLKLEERQRSEGSSTSKYSVKSGVRPLYKHLREMQTELNLWIDKAESLKDELKNRSASLCEIQEEITKALKASAEDDEIRFTSYQAAKFQGEILNMKQENKRVGDELQAGLDLAISLQRDADRALTKLSDDWGLSGPKSQQGGPLEVRSNIPLRSFIFGAKQKKQKTSIFSVVQPALQKKQHHKSGHSSSGR
ncbi:hypothetical protein F3Y22_tig00111769pilonHSYRG00212 [Hibiscus syriacus]|uniref:NAB domain-containing protein n=1 Tax=Hibiscus syriacus TaxID=106335 RepID=A0A6A2XF34_HIBSY|nr:hypothetical protein F3Y22_tig00111769pilonHSYRG00212 [Hibiscus syriacus]